MSDPTVYKIKFCIHTMIEGAYTLNNDVVH